ncbi:MAG: LruC domain-containing protein [Bacteroidetes bacterium]|nr:LruC domain-containing protein [Bacteroidota bacterium]
MKKIVWFCVAALLIFTSCNKKSETITQQGMGALKVSNSFTWNTSDNIEFRLHNIPAGVLRISSADESQLYLKAFFAGNANDYTVSVPLPTYETTIMINSMAVTITKPVLEFTFPNTKSGSVNYSMNFNGTTDWIAVSNTTGLSFPNKCSFEAWVKPTRQQTAKIIEKGDWDGCGLGQDLYKGFQASIYLGNFTSVLINWGSGQPTLNTWYHLAGVYDGSTLFLYVNGILKNSASVGSVLVNNGRNISIGSDAGAQKFFQGLIDEVSIWNTNLSLPQVNSSMSVPWTGSETGIKALWHFNEGSGNTAYDASASHYNGTITGALFNTDVSYALSSDSDGDGVPNSYDDYPNDPTRAYNNLFPSTSSGSLAFEDLWPNQGDYDFNDLVVNYQFNTITNAQNKIVECDGLFILKAAGASFPSGFGFQFANANIPSSAITVTGSSIFDNYITLAANGLEAAQNKPTVIITDDDFKAFNSPGGMINTVIGNPYINPDTIRITMLFSQNLYTMSDLDIGNFNPFIIINLNRGKEVHLPDHVPTALANQTYLGTGDDTSIPSQSRYYKTANNLPWAINIYENFDYARESADILSAYLHLGQWATSNGASFPDWYKNLAGYRNSANIYQH